MPYSSGPEQSGPNLAHWIGQWIGIGARSAADEISFLSDRAKTASSTQKSAWVRSAAVGTAMVGGEYVLLNPFSSRLDDLLSLVVSWLVLFLLPVPTPRLLLMLARFVAVGASLMNLRMGVQRLETLLPGLASWTMLFAAVWVGLLVVGLLWTARALKSTRPPAMATTAYHATKHVPVQSPRPSVSFKDVGGLIRIKDEIHLVADNRLRHNRSGVTRNGILLYGPQGTGKNLIAEATAGEYRVGFQHVRCPELIGVHIGSTAAEIRRVFESAYQCRPVVLFLDEIDSIGSRKQAQGNGTDAGGAGREYNAVTTQLMQSIDQSRQWDGFLLMAATNVLDGLEPTLIREGRFDAKLRIDLPDAQEREEVLRALVGQQRALTGVLADLARRTPGWSPARLKSLVDRALLRANGVTLTEKHLLAALEASGGADKPNFERVEWDDVVLPASTVKDLQALITLLEPGRAERLGLAPPTGLILTGAPGTGKTLTARLIASQTNRSFYPLSPSDVLQGTVGGSVQRLAEVFARAKEHAPSILFFDEMDGLFPWMNGALGQHDVQLVEQALIEISNLRPEHNVFLIGTTNFIERVDPRILRGGRFSEKIAVGTPDDAGYEVLLKRFLGKARLASGVQCGTIVERLRGLSPADVEAIVSAAKRSAMQRMPVDALDLPPLEPADFEFGITQIHC
jgi:transitional endoplasmic reticulum ATPase